MTRAAIIGFLLILAGYSGCIGSEVEECPDGGCFPMTSDGLNEILSQENALDVLLFASENSRLRVDTTSSSTIQGQFGEVHWSVTKDDEKEIRSISTRVTIGTYTYNNEVIDGGPITNIRVGNVWFEGRDASPSYSDPFVDFAVLSSQGQTENIPPFGFDTNSISDLDWRITADEESTQQVATSSNSTHSIVVELFGDPPRITSIETYSGEEEQFTIRVRTGEDVELSVTQGLTRAPLGFDSFSEPIKYGGISVWAGEVPSNLISEALPEEIEIRGLSTDDENATVMASLRLDSRYSNETSLDGHWWEFQWDDRDSDNLVSAGDLYAVRTNSTGKPSIATFDIWANSWTGGPLASS